MRTTERLWMLAERYVVAHERIADSWDRSLVFSERNVAANERVATTTENRSIPVVLPPLDLDEISRGISALRDVLGPLRDLLARVLSVPNESNGENGGSQ